MNTIYLLFFILTDQSGYETMKPVTNIKHNSMIECKIEKAQHKGIENSVNGVNKIQFLCGDETKFFNKKQRLY